MKKVGIGFICVFVIAAFMPAEKDLIIKKDTSLATVQEAVGIDFSEKRPKEMDAVSALIGEDIVKNGFSKRDGQKRSRRQSKHFVCIQLPNESRDAQNLVRL